MRTTALDPPFDPEAPYVHVRPRFPAPIPAPPIPEWRVELVPVIAAALGIRWPLYSF